MNDTSEQLVEAARAAMAGRETTVDFTGWAKAATAAVLRSLSDLAATDNRLGWPDSWALSKLADDIEGGGE